MTTVNSWTAFPRRPRNGLKVRGHWRVQVDHALGLRADRDFVHVDDLARHAEHRSPFRESNHRKRVRQTVREEPCAVDRINGDVGERTAAIADLFADV